MAKLSPAQEKALNEVNELGYTTARKNTLDSVAKYITAKGPTPEDGLKLNADGREVMGLPSEDESLESLLHGDPWKMGEQITADEPYLEFTDEPLADWERELLDTSAYDTYSHNWSPDFAKSAGFGETLNWRKTKVWDGLTATEIAEDIATARPVGRTARRLEAKIVRKVMRDLELVAA